MKHGLLLFALVGCTKPEAPVHPSEPPFARTAAVLAASACARIDGRLFSLATVDPDITDLFVRIDRCTAHANDGDLAVVVEGYAWVAVDRQIASVALHEFVHVGLRVAVRLAVAIAYRNDRAEVTLTSRPTMSTVDLEPVGSLDLEAQDWAGLALLELAPSAGKSPEAIAKRAVRTAAQKAFLDALAQPITLAYDGRTGDTTFDTAAAKRLRIAPHGTALFAERPPSVEPTTAHVDVVSTEGIAVRAVCRSLFDRLVEADRRGDAIDVGDWTKISGRATVTFPPMPCPWAVAARATGASTAAINLPPPNIAGVPKTQRDRWVSLDIVAPQLREEEIGPISLEIASAVWQRSLAREAPAWKPTIVILSPDETIRLRAWSPGSSPRDGVIFDTSHDVDKEIEVPVVGANARIMVRIRARAHEGPP